ncbi:MAG: hypothetical protein AAGA85_06525 [Bacteroidota bacterium]
MIRITTYLCFTTLLISMHSNGAFGANNEPRASSPPKLTSVSIFRLDQFSLGIGGGHNYGGLGVNATYYFTPIVGIYSGVGTHFRGANYSVGLKLRKPTNQSWNVNPYFVTTYGFNGRLHVDAAPSMSREFPGFAIGFGIDQKLTNTDLGAFTIGILMPIHGAAYHEYADFVEQSGFVSPRPLIPFRVTFGFQFVLR